jgi:CRP-like cAMP-binding protein
MDLLDFVTEQVQQTGQAASGAALAGERFVAFADWTPEALATLRGLGTVERIPSGARIIEAGARGERDLFVIVSGALEVYRVGGQQEQRLALLGPGDLVGEMSFVDGGPRSASVRTLTPSRVLRVRPGDLDALRERAPSAALGFMREIARILSFRLRVSTAEHR